MMMMMMMMMMRIILILMLSWKFDYCLVVPGMCFMLAFQGICTELEKSNSMQHKAPGSPRFLDEGDFKKYSDVFANDRKGYKHIKTS